MLAAVLDQRDREVQIGFAAGEALGEPERVTRLDQDMQSPALDFRAFAAMDLDRLCRLAHDAPSVRGRTDEPCPRLLAVRMRPKRIIRHEVWPSRRSAARAPAGAPRESPVRPQRPRPARKGAAGDRPRPRRAGTGRLVRTPPAAAPARS